ncbi:MAG: IS21 family transposase [Candidatus Methanoperedenaceae archaeon]|nr:IS21 family transposase [Candidatus Methanoperedenaceae archaeon]
MIETEEWFMIRDLHAQGLNITEISNKTGFDRKTVRKYLKLRTIPEPKKRAKRDSKLDNFKDYIIKKLNEGPFTSVRLFREIQEMGFTGKITIVSDFVTKVRPERGVPATLRYETKPGVQAQVDWSEFGKVGVDGKIQKLYCFNMILGYSRMRYIEFTLSIDVYSLIKCHMNAFRYFGGYTKEILYDNMKQVVIIRALKSTDSEWNTKFEDFFKQYGFIPRLCRPYRPQTKGKIENTVGYVRRDFFLGGSFSSVVDINVQAITWLKRVNSSVHGTTHEIPLERLKAEELKPIDGVPEFLIIREETRTISRDCFISYIGNQYSVPYQFAGREATLQIFNGKLSVIVGGEPVCEHEILSGSGRVSRAKDHFKGLMSEIPKENKAAMIKSGQSILKFESIEVEKRSLSVYESLIEG